MLKSQPFITNNKNSDKIHRSESRHIMKTNNKPSSVQPRLISRCVLSALALLAASQAAANKDFAHVPPYLDSQTSTSEVKIKPNVMLLIDDSGSMARRVGSNEQAGNGEPSRLDVTKRALHAVLDKYTDQVNWGLKTLNNSANNNGYTTDHKAIGSVVNRIVANGATPTTRRYYEVSGDVRTATKYRCEKNYIVLMSDGDANMSCFYSNDYAVLNYPLNAADGEYFGAAGAGQCLPDTLNGGNYHTFFDRDNGLRFFSNTLLNKDFKTSGVDQAGKSWNGDAGDPKDSDGKSLYEKQLVETFTVGFGPSLSAAGRSYLEKGAATNSSNGFFSATSAQELVDAFGTIFANIDAANAPLVLTAPGTTAPATTNPGQAASAAVVEVDSGSWSSRLKFYQINADGSVNTSAFSEPSFSGRQTIMNNGKTNHWVANLTDKDVNNAFFGISGGRPADQNEWKNTLLPWTVRNGDDSTLKSTAATRRYSQPYRVRGVNGQRDLGDILDSTLSTIGDQVNGRTEFMVTAANDGMVHLFQSTAGTNPYALKLSYMPAAMERDDDNGNATTMAKYLKDVAHENYGKSVPHRYMVNGGIVVRRTADSAATKGQQSFMFGAMGQGGRGAYALNIGGKDRVNGGAIGLHAGQNQWLSQVPLFETAKGTGNTLGYTVGTPQIGRVSIQRGVNAAVSTTTNVRYAGFLASGYRVKGTVAGKANETALYVYDMLGQNAHSGVVEGAAKGALIGKINVPNGVGGLSSPTLVDADFDGIVDVAYAGDYGGNMYRFDLRGDRPANWSVARIYAGNASQPITAAPAVSRRAANKYVVIFGTGSDIYKDDVNNTDQQAMYGIFDDLTQAAADAKQSDLLAQALTGTTAAGQTAYTLSNNKITTSHKGWRINLPLTGERVVVKPTMILRTAVFSTRSYEVKTVVKSNNGDMCIPEETTVGTSSSTMLLGVNAETGGMPSNRDARVQFIDKTQHPNLPYYTGIRQDGITSFTFMDTSKKTDTPVTADGDSGGSGTDGDLKPANTQIPVNQCFHKNELRTLLTNQGDSFKVDGRICALKRISWRELFF